MYKRLTLLVCIVTAAASVALGAPLDLKVDIGVSDVNDQQVVKAGWTEWSELRLDPGPKTAQKTFGDVTVMLIQSGGTGGAAGLAFRNGAIGGPLTKDHVCLDNQSVNSIITMNISGLEPGYYMMTTYHNFIFDPHDLKLDISVDGEIKVSNLPGTIKAATDDLAAKADFEFFTPSGDVVIVFGSSVGSNIPINGFEIQSFPATVEFESPTSGGTENIGTARLALLLKNAESDRTYTVDYAVTGGTATGGGVDYSLAGLCVCDFDESGQIDFSDIARITSNWLSQPPDSTANVTGDNNVNFDDFAACALEWLKSCGGGTTIQFDPGQSAKDLPIDIIQDGVAEEDETIEVTLSNPVGDSLQIGATAMHTYTISEAPPAISFGDEPSAGNESFSLIRIPVNLSHASNRATTVDYAVTGGTATGGGGDYTLANGTVQFPAGEVKQHISIRVIDDVAAEPDETVELTLSNPVNGVLGEKSEFTYSILDNDEGLLWDGLVWYDSERPSTLFVNADGNFEWPPRKGGQFLVRIPDQRISQVGDVAEVSYVWMTDGAHNCGDCEACDAEGGLTCGDDDITCVAGTSDIRVGLFDSGGAHRDYDGEGSSDGIFVGWTGYAVRFGPNMAEGPGRWVDCTGEVHKTGQFSKKPVDASWLLTKNSGFMGEDNLPGFELEPGAYSLFTLRLERTSSSSVKISVTLNGRTVSETDSDAASQTQNIDYLAVNMRNGRPYTRLVFAIPESPRSAFPVPADDSQDVSTSSPLTWRAGTLASSYDVYFGANETAVANATRASSEYKGNQTVGNFAPGCRERGVTYYWRIDDVTETGTLKGEVWGFSTVPCQAFEGFEAYDIDSLEPAWIPGGGSWAELSTDEKHTGSKSIRIDYYNRAPYKYSDLSTTFDQPQNWSDFDGLGLYFKGSPANANDKMYITVTDADGASATASYGGSTGDVRSENWLLWTVGFEQLGGVNTSAIMNMAITVGDKTGASSGAAGMLFIDDVGLCGGGCGNN